MGDEATLYEDARVVLTGQSGSGDIFDLQLWGGLAEGVSGSAMFVRLGGAWFCIAMAELGGRSASHSRGIGAAVLVRFLKENNIDVPFEETLPANEPIGVFSIGDWSRPILEKLNSNDGSFEFPYVAEPRLTPDKQDLFQLLHWRNKLTPLSGRNEDLGNLLDWAREGEGIRVRFLTGPGGSGKSRLAREAVEILREDGWIAGEISLDRARRYRSPQKACFWSSTIRSNGGKSFANCYTNSIAPGRSQHPFAYSW